MLCSQFPCEEVSGAKLSNYWVGTEEYDFVDLERWVSGHNADHCLFFDMSIANNRRALAAIASSVRKWIFIFDHHLLNEKSALPANVILANPTPKPQPKGQCLSRHSCLR